MSKYRIAFKNPSRFIRSFRRRRWRIVLFLASVYIFVILPFSLRRSERSQLLAYDAGIAHLRPPKVYIAAMLVNCAPLLSQYWIPALLGLIEILGPENVYVSILENGSVDDTRVSLIRLREHLMRRRVEHSFQFEDNIRDGTTFVNNGLLRRLLGREGTGDNWVEIDKEWFPRRISYLAALRNMVLEPLWNSSTRFEKVLFINDVIFSVCQLTFGSDLKPDDAIRLLQTNEGQYAAACGLDYSRPHLFYDTFAMRDFDGNPMIGTLFPFFPQGKTRRQLLDHKTNVEVKSCWNGMGTPVLYYPQVV
jgi:hypothetical protein